MNANTDASFSRRNFLTLGGAAALGTGAVLAGRAPAASASEVGDEKAAAGTDEAASWRIPPAAITDFADEADYDVVVVGHGYAGVCACRELAENGVKVALIERRSEDIYTAQGSESAAINSKILDEITSYNPVPHVDPVEFYQNWTIINGNQINPGLIMRYAQNMGDNIDWYYDGLTEDDKKTLTHTGWPMPGEEWPHLLPNIGPIKFFPCVVSCFGMGEGGVDQTKVQGYNREKAKAAGAEFFFGYRGEQLEMDGGRVAAVIASDENGAYHKFNCKAAVIATGGFAYNEEMLNDLMPDIANNMTEGEIWRDAFGNPRFESDPSGWPYQGDGIKMAYWAGAHLESIIAGINSKHIEAPTSMGNMPHAMWVRSDGKRFLNEFHPNVEHRGNPNVYMKREPIHCVFDSNIAEYRQWYVPQHGGTEPSDANLQSVRDACDKAYQQFKGTWQEPEVQEESAMGGWFSVPDYICDETLEGLAAQLGLEGEAVQNFLDQVERFNSYCESGVDEEFGRDAELLFPVKEPPFFAVSGNPGLGEIMATIGGIITNAEQNALDSEFEPIPGLYVSGNDCGRRFGQEYASPTPGVSLQMAITLGRECGKSVKAYLEAN